MAAPRGSRLPVGRDVDASERAQLVRACVKDTSASGYRDAAMFCLMMATGLRRAEVAALIMADVTFSDDAAKLIIMGKGDKQRTSYVRSNCLKALRDWLTVRGDTVGALFCVIGKGGRIQPERSMSTTARYDRRGESAKEAAAGLISVPYRSIVRAAYSQVKTHG